MPNAHTTAHRHRMSSLVTVFPLCIFLLFSPKFIIWDHFQLKKIYSISQIHLSMSCARHKLRQFNCLPAQTATVFYVLARTINERNLIFYKQNEIRKHSLCVCRDTVEVDSWNKSNRKGGRCWSVENETNIRQSCNWLPFLSMWAMMIVARLIPLITHIHRFDSPKPIIIAISIQICFAIAHLVHTWTWDTILW